MNTSGFAHRLRLLKSSRAKKRLLLGLLVVGVATVAAFRFPGFDRRGTPAVSFFQLDVTFDGDSHPDSQWGAVDLLFTGSDEILYFNLTVLSGTSSTEVWRIQNMPVASREGAGVLQKATFGFDLAGVPGKTIPSLQYAFALTTSVLDTAPGPVAPAPVGPRTYLIDTGYSGEPILFVPPNTILAGGAAGGGGPCSHEGFPNVDVGKDECVPGATSNSLNWMNELLGLGIPSDLITVEAMKVATGFDPALPGCDDNWPEKKAAYLAEHEIPVTSETISRFAMNEVLDAICAGCDVEIGIGKHAAAVTGITKLADGNYSIDFTHDDEQGVEGGQITETVKYDDVFGRFEGSPWLNNKAPEIVVKECPMFGNTPTPTRTPTWTPTHTPEPRSTKTPKATKTPRAATKTPATTKTPRLTKTPQPSKTATAPPTTGTPKPKRTKTPRALP